MKIRNAKTIQKKSKQHDIKPLTPNTFEVISGSSRNSYTVTIIDNGGKCTCKWSQYRPSTDNRSGCSHVVSVFNYLEALDNRTVSAWADVESAKRQHKPMLDIGDGVVITSRLAG